MLYSHDCIISRVLHLFWGYVLFTGKSWFMVMAFALGDYVLKLSRGGKELTFISSKGTCKLKKVFSIVRIINEALSPRAGYMDTIIRDSSFRNKNGSHSGGPGLSVHFMGSLLLE